MKATRFFECWLTLDGLQGLVSQKIKSAQWTSLGADYSALKGFFIIIIWFLDTAATPGLLCQPRVIVKMIAEKQMECRLAGETEVLGFLFIWFVRLLALRPLLAYCASLG
jgi:hypothetical protein